MNLDKINIFLKRSDLFFIKLHFKVKRYLYSLKPKCVPILFTLMDDGGTEPLEPPSYNTVEAAGADIRSRVNFTLEPGMSAKVPTGFKCEILPGYEIQVRPRSGLAAKNGITVLNAPGTVDSDYRGEFHVILINLSKEPYFISRGEKIAQLVCAPVVRMNFIKTDKINENTARGPNGFGSSGRH